MNPTVLGYGIGTLVIITGIILFIMGIIHCKRRMKRNEDASAWVWTVITLGILLMLIGSVVVIGSAFRIWTIITLGILLTIMGLVVVIASAFGVTDKKCLEDDEDERSRSKKESLLL